MTKEKTRKALALHHNESVYGIGADPLSILAAKLGRAVYLMLNKERAFDMDRFLAHNHERSGGG